MLRKRDFCLAGLLWIALALCPMRPAAAQTTQQYDVNIVAHEDDDVLFMQPDIMDSYAAGIGQVTVYLTSGNYQFVDDTVEMRQREMGAMDANAEMVLALQGVQGDNAGFVHWSLHRKAYGGMKVTMADCEEAPTLHLIFLRLTGGAVPGYAWTTILHSNFAPLPSTILGDMWNNGNTDRTVDDSNLYTPSKLTSVLSSILTAWKPRLVRTQDSDNAGLVNYDHADHYYGALFAKQALHNYVARTGAAPQFWIYRGYNINNEVSNVFDPYQTWKAWMFYYYCLADARPTGTERTDPNFWNLDGTGFPSYWSFAGANSFQGDYAGWISRMYHIQKPLP